MSNNTPSGGSIDPNTFTPDELLKHTYRLVLEMNAKMDEQKREFSADKKHHGDKVEKVQGEVIRLETRLEERDKNFKNTIAIVATGLSILSVGLSFLVYIIG